jgi:hypothetical protein
MISPKTETTMGNSKTLETKVWYGKHTGYVRNLKDTGKNRNMYLQLTSKFYTSHTYT